jgi:excisionase family DNA binding protein
MTELMTTDEAAAYLRISERKLYELVANGAVPCTKVTGKWLFPKAALDRWLAAGYAGPPDVAHARSIVWLHGTTHAFSLRPRPDLDSTPADDGPTQSRTPS